MKDPPTVDDPRIQKKRAWAVQPLHQGLITNDQEVIISVIMLLSETQPHKRTFSLLHTSLAQLRFNLQYVCLNACALYSVVVYLSIKVKSHFARRPPNS